MPPGRRERVLADAKNQTPIFETCAETRISTARSLREYETYDVRFLMEDFLVKICPPRLLGQPGPCQWKRPFSSIPEPATLVSLLASAIVRVLRRRV